LDKLISH